MGPNRDATVLLQSHEFGPAHSSPWAVTPTVAREREGEQAARSPAHTLCLEFKVDANMFALLFNMFALF